MPVLPGQAAYLHHTRAVHQPHSGELADGQLLSHNRSHPKHAFSGETRRSSQSRNEKGIGALDTEQGEESKVEEIRGNSAHPVFSMLKEKCSLANCGERYAFSGFAIFSFSDFLQEVARPWGQ